MNDNPREHKIIATSPTPDDEPSGYAYEGGPHKGCYAKAA